MRDKTKQSANRRRKSRKRRVGFRGTDSDIVHFSLSLLIDEDLELDVQRY